MAPARTLKLGRLTLGPPSAPGISEVMGDPVGQAGAQVVPAARVPLQVQIALNTLLSNTATVTDAKDLAQSQAIRRQLRSLLNNTPLKQQGFLYVQYSDDPEMNGWLIPDPTTLASPDGTAFRAVGLWVGGSSNWWLGGRRWTNKEARYIWAKDLRTGVYERDILNMVLSTDFAAQLYGPGYSVTQLAITTLPHGATATRDNVTGAAVPVSPMPTGRDGGISYVAAGLPDLETVSFERTEAAMNLSDVIVYDRRGQITAPSTGPDTLWEEAYGPDHAWNWFTAGQPNDAPVLDNGLVRVRYDASTGKPGFRVDVWSGAAYVEQGKVTFYRNGDAPRFDDTWVSAGLQEYTPDSAVLVMELLAAGDNYSREKIFVTLRRGRLGAQFECYPAQRANGTYADAYIVWSPAVLDVGDLAIKKDSLGTIAQVPPPGNVAFVSTVASGLWGLGTLGASSFVSSENWVSLLRFTGGAFTVTPYQVNLAVRQAESTVSYVQDSSAYGTLVNSLFVGAVSIGLGYSGSHIGFAPTGAQQLTHAQSMTLGAGASAVLDATASDGHAVSTQSTSQVTMLSKTNWPSSMKGIFRVFARVRMSLPGQSANLSANCDAYTLSSPIAINWSTYQWVDLGEGVFDGSGVGLVLTAQVSNAAYTLFVDAIAGFFLQDLGATPIYLGARDMGQAHLTDSKTLGAVVARS